MVIARMVVEAMEYGNVGTHQGREEIGAIDAAPSGEVIEAVNRRIVEIGASIGDVVEVKCPFADLPSP